MFFLKKLFEIRDGDNPEAEKPFLDHLDDLRVTITRIILTLLIGMIICYAFRNQLMEIIRHPVESVWLDTQKSSLKKLDPKPSVETWEDALRVANASIGLSNEQRAHLIKSAEHKDPMFAFHVESAFHFRAAQAIDDEKKRLAYISGLPGISDELRKQLKALDKGDPNSSIEAKGRMVIMQSLNPTEGFMLSIKLSFFAALVLTFPLLLYFILQFILPGMLEKEQKALFPALGIGFVLFLSGVLFAYFIILKNVLAFFYGYSLDMGIQNDWRIGYYISFATQFVLIFGLAFELPVVVMTLVKLELLSYDTMKSTRSYAILAIVVIAALITPTPDALTLGLLAGPMYILYESCIWLTLLLERKKRKAAKNSDHSDDNEVTPEPEPRVISAPGTSAAHSDELLDKDENGDWHKDHDDDLYHEQKSREEDPHFDPLEDEEDDHKKDSNEPDPES